ncbi:hypothetical protein D3C86_1519380 [compost metagenome]
MKHPQQYGRCRNRNQRVAITKGWEKQTERRFHQNEISHVSEKSRCPVAKRREKAEIVSKAFLRIHEDAGIQVRTPLRQGLENERHHEHANSGDGPGDNRAKRSGRLSECLRQRKYPGADHGADDHARQRYQRQLCVIFSGHGSFPLACHRLPGLRVPAKPGRLDPFPRGLNKDV